MRGALRRFVYWTVINITLARGAVYRSSVISPSRQTVIGDRLYQWPIALAIDFAGKQT